MRDPFRPTTLLEVSRRAAEGSQRFDPALREFLDEFYLYPDRRQASLQDRPLRLDPVKDAYLAATVEYLAQKYGCDVPAWTEEHGNDLHEPFFAGGLESLKAILTVESPGAFRRRLFVSKNALDRPRMFTPEPAISEPSATPRPDG